MYFLLFQTHNFSNFVRLEPLFWKKYSYSEATKSNKKIFSGTLSQLISNISSAKYFFKCHLQFTILIHKPWKMPFKTHISSLNTLAYKDSVRTFRHFNVPSFVAIYDATKFVICPRLQSFARYRISKAFHFYFKTKINPTISFFFTIPSKYRPKLSYIVSTRRSTKHWNTTFCRKILK